MTLKDTFEIGLKDDAPFRRDNLPDFQKRAKGPASKAGDPTRSPEEPGARRRAVAAARRKRPATKPKPARRRARA